MRPLPRLHPSTSLHRNVDRNPNARIPAVIQVVAVIDVIDINVIVVVPVISPVGRPRVDRTDPIAVVLEARISAYNQERQAVDAESVTWAEVSPETVVGNTVPVISASLLPGAMVGVPVLGSVLLPGAPLYPL